MSVEVVETPATPEVPAVDAAPPEAKPPEAPPKPKLGEFAKRAAAEREKVKAQQAEKDREGRAARAEAERDEARGKLAEMEARRASYTKNPIQALLDAFPGMEPVKAFELIADAAKNNGKPPVSAETYELRQKMERMETQRLEDQKAAKEASAKAAQEQAQAAERAFRGEVAEFVKGNAETYELIALYKQEDAVYATIEAHYAKTGEIMPTKDAAAAVEAKIEEMVDQALKAKKVAAKLKPAAPPEDPSPKTLTNDLAAQAKFDTGPAKSEAERMRRAMAALEKLGA